jgi:hypothetical protein
MGTPEEEQVWGQKEKTHFGQVGSYMSWYLMVNVLIPRDHGLGAIFRAAWLERFPKPLNSSLEKRPRGRRDSLSEARQVALPTCP